MLERGNKRDDRDSDDVETWPSRDRTDDTVATKRRADDRPANGAAGEDADEDRSTVSGAVETDPASGQSWMPTWWQFAAGTLVFGAAGLGLAWLGGVIGVVLIMALFAAVIWLLFRWASWE